LVEFEYILRLELSCLLSCYTF